VNPLNVGAVNAPKSLQVVQVYPNPTSSDVSVSINSEKATTAYIKVYSMIGVAVLNKEVALSKGSTTVKLNTATVAAGTYNVIITTSESQVSTRIIRQ